MENSVPAPPPGFEAPPGFDPPPGLGPPPNRGRRGGGGAGRGAPRDGGNRRGGHRNEGSHDQRSGGAGGGHRRGGGGQRNEGPRNYQPRDYRPRHNPKAKMRTDHNGEPFQGATEECILCCQKSDIFGIGQCRHPACLECSVRMRCFGESKTCHACREDIPMMYMVRKPDDWENCPLPNCTTPHPDLQKYQICFEDAYVARAYDSYNSFACSICAKTSDFAEFPSFPALKQHMTTHGLLYCYICVNSLNVLPKDHHTFNSHELKQHMSGEKNLVDGVRGHPMCQFCHQRFFDDEELYKHCRKEHFHCSICSEIEGLNAFFNRIDQLHKHYKQKHHPCLDPDCRELGIVFSNEFDLNVHKTQQHGGTDRKIPIEFQFSRDQTSRFGEASSRRLANQTPGVSVVSNNQPRYGEPPQQSGVTVIPSAHQPRPPPPSVSIIPSALTTGQNVSLVQRPNIVTQQNDFPLLSSTNAPNAYSHSATWRAQVAAARQPYQPPPPTLREQINSTNHFPTLGGASSTSGSQQSSSVWNRDGAIEVIKKAPAPRETKKPSPKPARRRIIPLPEVWPENMRRKLEARELGLPEPPDIDPPLPQPPLDINERKKKNKQPKKKTVSFETLKKRLNEQAALGSGPTTSKFSILDDSLD